MKSKLRVAEGEHEGFEFTDYPNRGAENSVKIGTKAWDVFEACLNTGLSEDEPLDTDDLVGKKFEALVSVKKTGKGNRTEHGTIGPHRPRAGQLKEMPAAEEPDVERGDGDHAAHLHPPWRAARKAPDGGRFQGDGPLPATLSSNIAFDAYFTGHKSGSYHAWNYAGKTGYPPAWPEGEDPEEAWEPDEDERDPAMDRDTDELEATVETYTGFLPEVLDKLERTCVSQAFSIWTGYAAFCEESMSVAAEKVGAVVLEPVMDRIEDMKARAERLSVEADAPTVEEMRETLAESWRMVEARGV